MSKLIIENKTDLSDVMALQFIQSVIAEGRVSNDGKQYCYVTTFTYGDDRYAVSTKLNKCSDKFTVTKRDKL